MYLNNSFPMKGILPVFLMSLLLTSSFISQMGIASADSPIDKENKGSKKVLEFSTGIVVDSSSTTTICHIPRGNPDNAHKIVVGTSSLTAHLNHGDSKGDCVKEASVQEFLFGEVETGNDTLDKAYDFMDGVLINTSSDSKLGPAVSQVAQLHKLFAHEDKEIKKDFQKSFLKFIKMIKEKIGQNHSLENKLALNDLGKAEIKIKSEIEKEEKEKEIQNKIALAIELKNEKELLQEIRNKIAIAKINNDVDTPQFEDLKNSEVKHLTKILISEAKSNGVKLTGEEIHEIVKKSSGLDENSDTQSDNGGTKSNNGKGSENNSKNGSDNKSNGKSKGKNK